MRKSCSKKKCFLLLSITVLFLMLCLVLSSKSRRDLPTSYRFISSTNSITFLVLDGYELYDISCDHGFFDISKIKPNSRSFDFDIGDMQAGQQEIVTISCKGKNDSISSVTYIILIQSSDELIIETYKNNFLIADDSFHIVDDKFTAVDVSVFLPLNHTDSAKNVHTRFGTPQRILTGFEGDVDEPRCHSVDGQYMAYVSDIDYSKPNSVTVSVIDNLGKANNSEPIKFELSQSALRVDDMSINNDILAVTGHINPSLQIYQRFDIPNQKLLSEYYGYGFIATEYGLFYVQAPQHFSGESGHCRILNEDGRVLYESPDNVTIRDLRVSGDSLFFDELDLDTGNMSEKNISVFASDHTLFSYY